jgi:hypothetical protein
MKADRDEANALRNYKKFFVALEKVLKKNEKELKPLWNKIDFSYADPSFIGSDCEYALYKVIDTTLLKYSFGGK